MLLGVAAVVERIREHVLLARDGLDLDDGHDGAHGEAVGGKCPWRPVLIPFASQF